MRLERVMTIIVALVIFAIATLGMFSRMADRI